MPGLGDIPILGVMGSSENHSKSTSVFYVFVRPTILRASGFEDLKALSKGQRIAAGIPADFPSSEPQFMR
jgi:type II secretory pathway component GspD/PulD (secretin)